MTGNTITGKLNFIEGGLASGTLDGDGWFVALKWTNPDTAHGVTSLKVGLRPSATGMDLQECIDDTDRNGVFKITPNLDQVLIIEQSNSTGTRTRQVFDLDFEFLPPEDAEGV